MSRWTRAGQTFWVLPAVLCLLAVVLAEALIVLDERIGAGDLGPVGALVSRVGASGSRDLLGAIAGSMLTVASTTFSITIAVLAVSSSTYGPRLVRNFMADRGNQLVLGVFVATFLYSLLVLRSIRVPGDGSGEAFVPHLAVNVAVVLAVVAIGVLVYFIHHISDSVQVWTLSGRVRADLLTAIDRLHPEPAGRPAGDLGAGRDATGSPRDRDDGVRIPAHETGYVRAVDHEQLVSLATRHDVVIRLLVRPGSHTIQDSTLALVAPPANAGEAVRAGIRKGVLIGRSRTPQEDVEFSIAMLEEIAVRALSPGTNDPYTALNALDDLSAGLVTLAGRAPASPCRHDAHGQLRVVAPAVALADLLDRVLDAMRCYAMDHPRVLHRTLDLVEQVAGVTRDPAARSRLDAQAGYLLEAFERGDPQACDAEQVRRHVADVRRPLAATQPGRPAAPGG